MRTKSAQETAKTLVEIWICREGRWPKTVLTDQGREFENQIIEEVKTRLGLNWIFTKGYNSRANGAVERVQRTIQESMKKRA